MKVELTKKCSNKTHVFIQTELGTKKRENILDLAIFKHLQKYEKFICIGYLDIK